MICVVSDLCIGMTEGRLLWRVHFPMPLTCCGVGGRMLNGCDAGHCLWDVWTPCAKTLYGIIS